MEHPQDTERLDYTSAAEQEKPKYTPRPRYQIVLAWIGAAIVVGSVILYYAQIMHKY